MVELLGVRREVTYPVAQLFLYMSDSMINFIAKIPLVQNWFDCDTPCRNRMLLQKSIFAKVISLFLVEKHGTRKVVTVCNEVDGEYASKFSEMIYLSGLLVRHGWDIQTTGSSWPLPESKSNATMATSHWMLQSIIWPKTPHKSTSEFSSWKTNISYWILNNILLSLLD